MTRPLTQHPPIPLVGTTEAATIIGVSVSNLRTYDPDTKTGVRGLPRPVAELKAGRIWYGPDICAFAEHYQATRARRGENEVIDQVGPRRAKRPAP
jgi:hypothetical protein